ncbi:MAG: sigma-70 family RNA polymerase sigma factor [Planctomycetes bacterium]|nr:sigma-70 family RNA polymerase sigma factor [Planctomycetota bacterium]
MADISDEELMLMFKYGDLSAFDLLFEQYRSPLMGFLVRMLGDRGMAEDVFQETFLRVARFRHRYEPKARFRSWLYRIALNCGRNALKERGRQGANVLFLHRKVSTAAGEDLELLDQAPAVSVSPLKRLEEEELKERVQLAIAQLPERYREAYILYELQGLKYEQIAEVLEIPLGTVKTNLHRARRMILDLIRPYVETEDGQRAG